jgi:hypothetical protein
LKAPNDVEVNFLKLNAGPIGVGASEVQNLVEALAVMGCAESKEPEDPALAAERAAEKAQVS